MPVPAPLPAATLVLLRPESRGFSVLLMQRPIRSSFMGGMHVFPGGKVEPSDSERSAGALSRRVAGNMRLTPREACGYIHAALRETFEEMGLLLGVHRCSPTEKQSAREMLAKDSGFWNHWPDTASDPAVPMAYFDHWITPTFEAKRFDTRFFASIIDVDASPDPNHEAVHWQFYRPAEALEAARTGSIRLSPPTLVTIMRLQAYDSARSALESLDARHVSPLLPELVSMEPVTLALPGHPQHSEQNAAEDNPTSMVLEEGNWVIQWKRSPTGQETTPSSST